MTQSAYIHIPFCTKKCNYCSFVSFDKLNLKTIYLDALISEIKANYKNEELKTLYFGGGTPSTLSVSDFEQILNCLNFNSDTELTVEINPNDIERHYLAGLKKLGVNRLSIGVQVFDDEILSSIGRTHEAKQAIRVIEHAQHAGFENISIDLIYGLPNQTIEGYKKTLDTALSLGVQHISLYGLKIEKGCNFYNHRPDFLPDDDMQADMYLLSKETLENAGFKHYEISNFAKPGCESKHNLNYWNNSNYYGFGVAAHGYIDEHRYANEVNIDKYLLNSQEPKSQEKLTKQQMLEEEIFLGFRKAEGLNISYINKKFDIDFEKDYATIIDKYTSLGHLEKTPSGYTLTTEGILLSNTLLSEFIQ